ncbi:MAG: hypothetical protein ACOX0Z_02550 [Candidatus Nanosyncoccaceae bacterium]|jgi:hypothetical protein
MGVSKKNKSIDVVIELIECLGKIKTDEVVISFYAEKMVDENGNEIMY